MVDGVDGFDGFDTLPVPEVVWYPDWLPGALADRLLDAVVAEVAWRQDSIGTPRGRVPLPRLSAWQGEPGARYRYSGILNVPAPWSTAVGELKQRVEATSGARFNSVLLNRYRSGADALGWHSDDEPELGAAPVIASVSLGVARRFELKHVATGTLRTYRLTHGSLLVMRGATQRDWRHRVPRAPDVAGERINLTFRQVDPR
ncbi:MAG: hypothetical protein GAK40_01110 [Burkholderia plantarii]|nr:MAG: hypothetical protein GAK40_01110 [Burkholderia plantarii]